MSTVKRKSMTLETKRNIITMIESGGKTQSDIAREFELSKSTVNTVWINRDKYKLKVPFGDHNKKMRKSTYYDVEDALLIWLKQARSLGAPVSSSILKEKAAKLAKELGYAEFSCSDGWLDRFKKRRDVILRVISGESESVPQQLKRVPHSTVEQTGSKLHRWPRTSVGARGAKTKLSSVRKFVTDTQSSSTSAEPTYPSAVAQAADLTAGKDAGNSTGGSSSSCSSRDEDAHSGLSSEKALHYSIILAEINRKYSSVNFRPG